MITSHFNRALSIDVCLRSSKMLPKFVSIFIMSVTDALFYNL